jgi:hypothetical protein
VKKYALPPLVPLRFGSPYCEFCRRTLRTGELICWHVIEDGSRSRKTAVCRGCRTYLRPRRGRAA